MSSASLVAVRTARRLVLVPATLGIVLLLGCRSREEAVPPQASRPPAADMAARRAEVRRADSAFAAAAAAHDLEGSVGSLSEDGMMFPPDEPPVIGRPAVREYMRHSFETPHFSVAWTTDTIVVSESGDMAYSFARSRYTFPGHSGKAGAIDTAYGKGLSVWRRDADGRWRTVADIWNGAPTLPPIRPSASTQ